MDRFIIQDSVKENHVVCTDTINNVVCIFETGKFNESQTFTFLEDSSLSKEDKISICQEMVDWLGDKHYGLTTSE